MSDAQFTDPHAAASSLQPRSARAASCHPSRAAMGAVQLGVLTPLTGAGVLRTGPRHVDGDDRVIADGQRNGGGVLGARSSWWSNTTDQSRCGGGAPAAI